MTPLDAPAAEAAARAKVRDFPTAPPGRPARAFAADLLAAGNVGHALTLVAYALDRRLAVWWACACVRGSGDLGRDDRAALDAAEAWCSRPDDDGLRRAAGAAGDAVEYETPAGMCALAAFWSGGSLSPAGQPEVSPKDHLCQLMAAQAANAAAGGRKDAAKKMMEIAEGVASGRNKPPERAATPAPATRAPAAGAVRPPVPRPPVPRRP